MKAEDVVDPRGASQVTGAEPNQNCRPQVRRPQDQVPDQHGAWHLAVLDLMLRYGGSFVKALSLAWERADPQNHVRLYGAFGCYYDEYARRCRAPAVQTGQGDFQSQQRVCGKCNRLYTASADAAGSFCGGCLAACGGVAIDTVG